MEITKSRAWEIICSHNPNLSVINGDYSQFETYSELAYKDNEERQYLENMVFDTKLRLNEILWKIYKGC